MKFTFKRISMMLLARWNLTPNGEYSAYNAQFFGATVTTFNKLVWKAPPPERSSSSLGLLSAIVFGRQIDLRGEDGTIVAFAHFANKPKRLRLISSLIAATPIGFGI
jgi:hypothetical protein